MRLVNLIISLLLLNSCTKHSSSPNNGNDSRIKQFIDRQNLIKLPARIELYTDNYNLVYPEESDTSIFHESTLMGIFGVLEDTSRYYYVIPMFPGDDLCPLLYVFNKKGKIIEKSRLIVGKYGVDCGSSLYGYTIISKDLEIFTQDSLAQYSCDTLDNVIKDSLTIYLTTQKMAIMPNGKVKHEKEIENIIK